MSPGGIIGACIVAVFGLAGALYASIRAEQKRQAKNLHYVSNLLHAVILTLAAHGIRIKIQTSQDNDQA